MTPIQQLGDILLNPVFSCFLRQIHYIFQNVSGIIRNSPEVFTEERGKFNPLIKHHTMKIYGGMEA
jgi:hypothetical protein